MRRQHCDRNGTIDNGHGGSMGVVLVVDSRGDVAQSVVDAFAGRAGSHTFIERRSGLSALSALRDGIPVDVVVSDDTLEDMDGIEFVASVRRLDPDLPVILSSGTASVETYLKALNSGVFDFLTRPVSSPLLRRIMTVALREADALCRVSQRN